MKQSYCTKCGQETKRQAENLFVCPDGHEDWINAVPGVTCFILKDGKVLYGIRSGEPNPGGLDVAGGFLDLNETAEKAAVREAKEELGVDVNLLGYLGSYVSDYAGRTVLNLIYVGEMIGGEVRPADDMNGGDPIWFAIDDLPAESELSWPWVSIFQAELVKWHKTHYGNDR